MSESIYERYCRLRDLAGYKDSEVAKGSGVTKSTFSDWKNGRYIPKQVKLQKIANFLKVSVDYLMAGNEEPEMKEVEIVAKEKKLMEYAQKLLDLGIDPEALESLIDAVERMQKKD